MSGKPKGKEEKLVRNPYIHPELFTPRQWEMLDLYINNATIPEIADRMRVNESTVRKFIYGSVSGVGNSESIGRTELGVSGVLDSIGVPPASPLKLRLVAADLYVGSENKGGIVFPQFLRDIARGLRK